MMNCRKSRSIWLQLFLTKKIMSWEEKLYSLTNNSLHTKIFQELYKFSVNCFSQFLGKSENRWVFRMCQKKGLGNSVVNSHTPVKKMRHYLIKQL